jgi:flagellar hook-associated protein 1 FlgK
VFNQVQRSSQDAQVAQRGMQVAGHNLAHASDPTYAAQRLALRDGGTIRNGQLLMGSGVRIETLLDLRNEYLDIQVLHSQMELGLFSGQEQGLLSLENSLGEELDRRMDAQQLSDAIGNNATPFGLSKSLDDLFMSFSRMAANPALTTSREIMLSNAQLLVKNFQLTAKRMEQTTSNTVNAMGQGITSIQNILKEAASLNKEINRLEGNGVSTSLALDLRGKRQQLLEDLAQWIDFKVEPSEIAASSVKLTTYDTNGAEVVLLDATYSINDLQISGHEVMSNGKALDLKGGKMAGLQALLKTHIPESQSNLDAIAKQLVVSVNATYNPNQDAGRDFFDGTKLTAKEIALDPNLSTSNIRGSLTGSGTANEIFLALESLKNQEFSLAGGDAVNGTLTEAYHALVVGVGHKIKHNDTQLSIVQSVTDRLGEDRMNRVGVSFEEEFSNLTQYSYVYTASLKVMECCMNCIDKLLSSC